MWSPGPYRVYLIFSGATSLLFALIFTIMAVYRVQVAGTNPLQLVLVGTALEVTYFLFNVPTGVVADTYSRKLSVVIGVLLFGMGFVLEGSFPIFGAIILAQVIEGFGYTFMEGALEAWISDEVGEERVGQVFLRGSRLPMSRASSVSAAAWHSQVSDSQCRSSSAVCCSWCSPAG